MKKWFLKQFGRFLDFILPKSTKVIVPDDVIRVANSSVRGVEKAPLNLTHAIKSNFCGVKEIKINPQDLKNPLAGLQHEPLTHTPIHSQETPLVRALDRHQGLRQRIQTIEARLPQQTTLYPHSGTGI